METAIKDMEMACVSPAPGNTGMEESLIQATESRLGVGAASATVFTWEPIARGGSEREFYRVRHSRGESWVVMHYSDAREENRLYPAVAGFLRDMGLRVPQILFHDSDLRLIGLEDLGDESLYVLFKQQQADRSALESLYRSALGQLRVLHQHTSAPVRTMPGFDEDLYHWERDYFLENLVQRWAGVQLSEAEQNQIQTEGSRMAANLLSDPLCLIHRDFQSQNLMVRNQAVWLIDFQGMRPGHAAYDLASLLYDPYVTLDDSQRTSLLDDYIKNHPGKVPLGGTRKNFESHFYRAAVQRLMQALGAYSFLGLVNGKSAFLQYIPQGLKNLRDALKHLEGMDRTLNLTHTCIQKCNGD